MAVRKSKSSSYRKFRVYIGAAILGGVASATALTLFSLLVFFTKMPLAQSEFFSVLAFAIGCLVSGFTAAVKKRHGGLATGIKAALLFAIPVALVGSVLGGFTAQAAEVAETAIAKGTGAFGKIIIAVLCGSVGGVLGVNRNGGF